MDALGKGSKSVKSAPGYGTYNSIMFGLPNKLLPGGEESDPYGGQPGVNSYIGMDPDAIAQAGQAGQYDRSAMNAFTNEAMRSGPGKGAQLALKDNTMQNRLGMDQSRRMAGGQAAQAQSNLAMRGGLSGGAAERLQQGAANNALDLNQRTSAQSSQNRSNILMGDEANRMGQLGAANEMQIGASNRAFDRSMAVNEAQARELARRNAFSLGAYNSQMQAWGAGKTADATADSGKK